MAALHDDELKSIVTTNMKRTFEMFYSNYGTIYPEDQESQKLKLSVKVLDDYSEVKDLPPPPTPKAKASKTSVAVNEPEDFVSSMNKLEKDLKGKVTEEETVVLGHHPYPSAPGVSLSEHTSVISDPSDEGKEKLIQSLPISKAKADAQKHSSSIVEYRAAAGTLDRFQGPGAQGSTPGSRALSLMHKEEKPEWHAPWKLMRVISGHLGAVRSVSVDVSNQWFATGSFDRTIKIWDLASGTLKLTLTGHINAVRGLCISERHPYLFSCGEDKMVKCWDLEYNKVIRQYHGHLSGVYCAAMHPTIDVLITGGRDSTARVWDIRTKAQIFALSGHTDSVMDVRAQGTDPQILSSSADFTVRMWDLAAGKNMGVLTNHKKSVRAMVLHPSEYTFASASADNIKTWKFPAGDFIKNLSGHNAIINTLAVNTDNVLFSGADNGSMYFWDWKTGYNFQQLTTTVQPGSLESEAGIFASVFDRTSTRLITCEADKTIKIWKEDETATPETHPVNFKSTRNKKKW